MTDETQRKYVNDALADAYAQGYRNGLSDADRSTLAQLDADYEQSRVDDKRAMTGLAIAIILTLVMAMCAYNVIRWYVGTMPTKAFVGFSRH